MAKTINQVLIESSRKLIESKSYDELKNELLYKAPPVLWFGNLDSNKSKILTIGANPSREEFLSMNSKVAKDVITAGKSPSYLKGDSKRLYHLNALKELENIKNNASLRDELIQSYNDYFKNTGTVYSKWFGKKTGENELSYNVEGFLNSLDSSYYTSEHKFSAIHVDLLPFATISDFTALKPTLDKYYFNNGWAQSILRSLIELINPVRIIVFGKTNTEYFINNFGLKYNQLSKFKYEKENEKKCSSKVYEINFKNIPTIGLSVNLGNPRRFDKKSLIELGKFVS